MGYFDGNTVTAFWNYAQNFAMSDNNWTDTFGPSTPGALEVVSGQTNGAQNIVGTSSSIADGQGGLTLIGDTDPAYDQCSPCRCRPPAARACKRGSASACWPACGRAGTDWSRRCRWRD
jgi:hypothetical protein